MRRFWARSTPTQAKPRVSVIIPLYNHASYITAAVESVLDQGTIVQEILVVDDGSTDESAAVMAGLIQRDSRIGFMGQSNQGAHNTINGALQRCSGEFLSILNSDDIYLPGRLSALASALDADAAVGIAASGIAFMDGHGKTIDNTWYDEALAFHRTGTPLGVALINGNFAMTTSNFLFRRSMLERVGMFAAFRYVHDLDWLLRAIALGQGIVFLDQVLLRYRIHGSNTIAENHTRVRAEWAMAAAGYLSLLWDAPGAPALDWNQVGQATDVLRRHGLDRAVTACMAYLRRSGTTPLDRSPMLEDTAFRNRVQGWV